MTFNIGGNTGGNGQILTSNGTTCSWANPSLGGSGISDYLTRWTSSNSFGTGVTRDNNSTVGINTSPDPGFMLKVNGAGSGSAITGLYTSTRFGGLGDPNFGARGQYDASHYGYLGNMHYGVYGYNGATTSGDAGVDESIILLTFLQVSI